MKGGALYSSSRYFSTQSGAYFGQGCGPGSLGGLGGCGGIGVELPGMVGDEDGGIFCEACSAFSHI